MKSKSRKSTKPENPIFAVVDDGNFQGYFKTEDLAFSYVTTHFLENSVILTITQAYSVVPPEEPDFELQSLKLNDLLEE